jgi:hypothetical protein
MDHLASIEHNSPTPLAFTAISDSFDQGLGCSVSWWDRQINPHAHVLVVVSKPCLFARLISHQPAVLFSQNKPATSNQPAVLSSQNKPAPAISHQPTEQAA